jgi:hypothetical protein
MEMLKDSETKLNKLRDEFEALYLQDVPFGEAKDQHVKSTPFEARFFLGLVQNPVGHLLLTQLWF